MPDRTPLLADANDPATQVLDELREHFELLRDGVFGTPHSLNPTSSASTALLERARARVLEFFRASADEYVTIFTANATGALPESGRATYRPLFPRSSRPAQEISPRRSKPPNDQICDLVSAEAVASTIVVVGDSHPALTSCAIFGPNGLTMVTREPKIERWSRSCSS